MTFPPKSACMGVQVPHLEKVYIEGTSDVFFKSDFKK